MKSFVESPSSILQVFPSAARTDQVQFGGWDSLLGHG